MADGYSMGAGDLFRSRILGTGMEDTPYNQNQIGSMMGGMQPQQLMAFFQNPQVQEQFKQFGVDPQAMLGGMRQSPFFPNQFMQHHPQLGGGLSQGLANVAMTPKPDLVQGFGAGMTNMAQGLQGGPEMLRQYQLHQMMAPMGALGSMMPMFGEQRRRAIEEAIVAQEQRRPGEFQEAQISRREPRINQVPGGYVSTQYQDPTQQQPPQPQQGPWGGQFGISPLMAPGMPAQPGGWQQQEHITDPDILAKQAAAKDPLKAARAKEQEQETSKGMPGAKVDETKSKVERNRALAGKARQGPGAGKDYAKDYNAAEKEYTKAVARAKEKAKSITDPKAAEAYVAEQETQARSALEQSKANIDKQRGDPGASTRGLVSPGAQQGPPPPPPGQQQKPQARAAGGNIHVDEAGNLWDMSNPQQPKYAGKQQ